jgi:hypothetical protein
MIADDATYAIFIYTYGNYGVEIPIYYPAIMYAHISFCLFTG